MLSKYTSEHSRLEEVLRKDFIGTWDPDGSDPISPLVWAKGALMCSQLHLCNGDSVYSAVVRSDTWQLSLGSLLSKGTHAERIDD